MKLKYRLITTWEINKKNGKVSILYSLQYKPKWFFIVPWCNLYAYADLSKALIALNEMKNSGAVVIQEKNQ